jgi:hypothetical protein
MSSAEERKDETGMTRGCEILLRYPYRLVKRDGVSAAFWEGAFDMVAHSETDLPI